MGGLPDDNSALAVSNFLKSCKNLAIRLNTVVLVIHHFNNSGDIRGSSAFLADVFFLWKLFRSKSEGFSTTLDVDKIKEGSTDNLIKFQLEQYDLGIADQWGEPISTLRVVDAKCGSKSELKKKQITEHEASKANGQLWLLAELQNMSEKSLLDLKKSYATLNRISQAAGETRIKRIIDDITPHNFIVVEKRGGRVFVKITESGLLHYTNTTKILNK